MWLHSSCVQRFHAGKNHVEGDAPRTSSAVVEGQIDGACKCHGQSGLSLQHLHGHSCCDEQVKDTWHLAGQKTVTAALVSEVPACREGPWQRAWASNCHRTLRTGATIGAAMIIVVVFLFSFGGFLAAWSGYFVPTGPEDYGNTILFTLLANSKGATTPTARLVPFPASSLAGRAPLHPP